MRKLALNDEILLKIEKPARYIGNEVNSVMKDPEKVSIRFAMCFPDVYEMCYTNILQVLDLSGIPMQAADRTWDDPIVIGGGPCTYNPEPLAEFFDLFYMGEGETVYDELLNVYKENKKRGGTRKEFLEMAAEIEGIYVPAFYDVTYKEDGTIESFRPNNPHAKEKIKKQVVMDMTSARQRIRRNRSCRLSRQHRIESFLRSREAVSVDAVSARPECYTVQPVKRM